jgi:hypothetical protein
LKHRQTYLLLLEVATNGLGWLGAAFVAYGGIAMLSGQTWGPIETYAPLVSSFLTIVGTGMTAASVYFYVPNAPQPIDISTKVTAPIVLIACTICLITMVLVDVPAVIINGFAMLGLAGALFRLRPNETIVNEAPK